MKKLLLFILMMSFNLLTAFSSRYKPLLKAVEDRDIGELTTLLKKMLLPKKDQRELLAYIDSLINYEQHKRPSSVPAAGQILLGTMLTSISFHYFSHCPQRNSFLENMTSFFKGEINHGQQDHIPFLTTLIKCAGVLYGIGPLLIYSGYSTLTNPRKRFYELLACRARICDPGPEV